MYSSPEYRNLFEAFPDPAFRLDRHGTILDLNAAALAELPRNAPSLIGQTIQASRLAGAGDALVPALAATVEQGAGSRFEFRACANGRETHHEVRLAALAGNEALALIRDMTESKVNETSLRDSAAQFRVLANHLTDALWIRSPDMKEVRYVSPAFERIWGRPASYLSDHPHEWVDFVVPEDRDYVVRTFAGLTGNTRSLDVEYRIARPDGERRWVRVRGFQVHDEQGNLICHAGIATDTTDRKLAQARLEAAQKELIEARETELRRSHDQLRTFAHSLSHDLRAPLTAMSSFSQLLAQELAGVTSGKALHFLARIRANAGVAEQLINDLLFLEGVSRAELTREQVDLGELAREVLGVLQAAQPQRQVNITIQDGLNAHSDRNLTRIALQHLLSNAWHFTAGDGASIEVGSQSGAGAEQVFFVRDNGRGFDMEYADKLFSRPQRLHRDVEPMGTGLGLMVAHRVIGRHAGRMWMESAPGAGATFFFTLPSR